MIKTGFMIWLNEVFTREAGDLKKVKVEVMVLAAKLGVTIIDPAKISPEAIQTLCISIMGNLNNIPGNLWAGDKTENQRLNSLRQRIDGIRTAVGKSGGHQTGVIAYNMLAESLKGDGDKIYKEILKGALEHFPDDPQTRATMSADRVEEILHLLSISGEVDAMPSIPELGRLNAESVKTFLTNLPVHFRILELYQSGMMEEAMLLLSKLENPYTDYLKK